MNEPKDDKQTKRGDPEIDVLQACINALLSLDSDQRARVLEYIEKRFEEETA